MPYTTASAFAHPEAGSSGSGLCTSRRSLPFSLSRLRGIPVVPCIAAFLAIGGVVCIAPTALYLSDLWKTDPLKSIGSLVPLVSLVLVLRAWRTLRWIAAGSWWGLALLLVTVALVRLREGAVVEVILTRSWTLALPPPSLIAVGYAAGCVLLFGGPRLLRVARFPVLLMALVNPVPHVFVRRLDLPLQYASAHLARSFAHAVGARLTADQLRLMFTPEFGMFIAPGCNGLRGAIALGLLALIAGHLYRLRPFSWSLLVLAAIGLGYVFNFLRLFGLVLYYMAALHFPWLQGQAEMADYLLGGMLFFCAAFLLFTAVHRTRAGRDPFSFAQKYVTGQGATYWWLLPGFALRSLTFAGLIGWSATSYAAALRNAVVRAQNPPRTPVQFFPSSVGSFALRRQWDESLPTGVVLYHWAEYAQRPRGPVVAVAVSHTLGAHDTLLCHVARGEDWLWHGDLDLPSASGQTISFSASLYNDGVNQLLEATTLCNDGQCGEHTLGEPTVRHHRLALVYSRITPGALWRQPQTTPVPIVLRSEVADAFAPADQAREQMTAELRLFMLRMDPVLLGRSRR